MTIRQATIDDSKNILPLWIDLMEFHSDRALLFKTATDFKDQVHNDIVKLIVKPNTKIFVAEIDEIIVGFSTATISARPTVFAMTKKGYIGETFVDDKFRGKSIGTSLLSTVKDYLASQNVDFIDLQVTVTNNSAVDFWKKNGFEIANYYMVSYMTHKRHDNDNKCGSS
jgi:ribosomal protein S18 acetylase RimI-like enzyme